MKYWLVIVLLVVVGGGIWLVLSSLEAGQQEAVSNSNNLQQSEPPTSNVNYTKVAVLETNFGNIEISLAGDDAPKTAANFEKLVSEDFYNNLTFHRVIPRFVVQGGDPLGDGTGGPGYTLPAEIKLKHTRGAVAMARLSDQVNPNRESSGSQFYIVLQDLPALDEQYTVFGQVTAGMDVVDKIAAVETDTLDKPLQPVIIKKAYLKD